MSATPLLDASAYSWWKRGHAELFEAIRAAPVLLVPAVVLGELLGGFERSRHRERNRRELREFLSSPRVRVAPIGPDTADCYGRIYARLRSEGTMLGANDLWIAAGAMELGAEVWTVDADFRRVVEARVRTFPRPASAGPPAG